MDCSGTSCSLSTPINTTGSRRVRVGVFNNNTLVGNYSASASFTVNEKVTINSPTIAISSADASATAGQSYTVQLALADLDGDLKNVFINWGDGSAPIERSLSGNSRSEAFTKTYNSAGSFTWSATVYDHGGRSSSANRTVSVTSNIISPSATTQPASNIGANNARLNASINPNGISTSYIFEYGLSTSYDTNVKGHIIKVLSKNKDKEIGQITKIEASAPYVFSGHNGDAKLYEGEYILGYTPPNRTKMLTFGPIKVNKCTTRNNTCVQTNITVNFKDVSGQPVILLHGIFGSSVSGGGYPKMPEQLCTGGSKKPNGCEDLEFYKAGPWKLPLGWPELQKELENRGFDVYPLAWDWRLFPDQVVVEYLRPKINKILNDTKYQSKGIDRVDIVAHSMGGLVARWFIQNTTDGASKVDRFVMVGTPNGGSVNGFYFGLQGEPLKLDKKLFSFKPYFAGLDKFYTNAMNNLTMNMHKEPVCIYRQPTSVKPVQKDCKLDQGSSIEDYTGDFTQKSYRQKVIKALAPGASLLNPVSDHRISYLKDNKAVMTYANINDNPDGNTLLDLRAKNLQCSSGMSDRSSLNSVFTWLLLTTTQPTITMADVIRPNQTELVLPLGGDYTMGKGINNPRANSGDGTVPTAFAKLGMEGISRCIKEVGDNGHAQQIEDINIRDEIHRILTVGRAGSVQQRSAMTVASESLPAPLSAMNINIELPLATLLSNEQGLRLGHDIDTGDYVDEFEHGSMLSSAERNVISITDFAPGRYRLAINAAPGYVGRLTSVHVNGVIGSSDIAFSEQLVKGDGIDEVDFDINDNGEFVVHNRPASPYNVSATLASGARNMQINWIGAQDAAIVGYRVYAKEKGRINFVPIAQLSANETAYMPKDIGFVSGASATAYEFIVVAVNASGKESFVSNRVSNRNNEVPSQIKFEPESAMEKGKWSISKPVTISGITDSTSINIREGEYSINGGTFTREPGILHNGDVVRVRVFVGF